MIAGRRSPGVCSNRSISGTGGWVTRLRWSKRGTKMDGDEKSDRQASTSSGQRKPVPRRKKERKEMRDKARSIRKARRDKALQQKALKEMAVKEGRRVRFGSLQVPAHNFEEFRTIREQTASESCDNITGALPSYCSQIPGPAVFPKYGVSLNTTSTMVRHKQADSQSDRATLLNTDRYMASKDDRSDESLKVGEERVTTLSSILHSDLRRTQAPEAAVPSSNAVVQPVEKLVPMPSFAATQPLYQTAHEIVAPSHTGKSEHKSFQYGLPSQEARHRFPSKQPDCQICMHRGVQDVTFLWRHGGRNVYLTGSFFNWCVKVPLLLINTDGGESVHVVTLVLMNGHHEYKYIVDGKWMLDRDLPTIPNNLGGENHVIHVA